MLRILEGNFANKTIFLVVAVRPISQWAPFSFESGLRPLIWRESRCPKLMVFPALTPWPRFKISWYSKTCGYGFVVQSRIDIWEVCEIIESRISVLDRIAHIVDDDLPVLR
jgi:hypothetical protein